MRHGRPGVMIAFGLLLGFSLVVGGLTRPDEARAMESDEQQLLDLINAYRAENGLGALSPSPTLQTAAERHSEDMSAYGFFSHTTQASSYYPVGSGRAARVQAEGYPADAYTAENLAMDYATPEEVLAAWQNSPGHNAALLDGAYTVAGIGHVGAYWTLDMGSVGGAESPNPDAEAPAAAEEQYEEEPEQPATEGSNDEDTPRKEPGETERQYEEQNAEQAQYDATDAEETTEEPAPEEPPAANTRYDETRDDAAEVEAAAEDTTGARQYGDASSQVVPSEATPPGSAPSDEDLERYVAEALASEEQYDPSEISGTQPPNDAPGTSHPTAVNDPQPAAPQSETADEPTIEDDARAAEPAIQEAAPAAKEAATATGETPAEDAEPQEVRATEEQTAQAAVEVAAPEAEKSEASSPGERRANVSVFGITRLPDTGGQAEGTAPGGRDVELAFVVFGAVLLAVGVGLTVLGRLVVGR